MTRYFDNAQFVRGARACLDKSQVDFAHMLGVGRQSVIRWERGGNVPRVVLLAIRHLLHVNCSPPSK